jgi:hypothetical protein
LISNPTYLDNAEKLWELSKERVEQGSLEALLPKDIKSKRLRIPPDKSFLEDLTLWRSELAKDIHKRNPEFDVKLLNDVVQRLLDRIIFIRIAEDRRIRPHRELWENVAQWKEEGKRKSIMTHVIDLFHEINDDLNGDIFKPHACHLHFPRLPAVQSLASGDFSYRAQISTIRMSCSLLVYIKGLSERIQLK